MKTDRERLKHALDFAYLPRQVLAGTSISMKSLGQEIDTFLGSTPVDLDNLDLDNLWPDCPGDAGIAVSVAGPIQMTSFDVVSLLAFQRKVRDVLESAVVEAVEIKMAVDGEDYALALPAAHGGGTSTEIGQTSFRFIGEGVNRILEIHAEPQDAYLLIVGLLVKGEAKLRMCAADDCVKPFVRQGRRQYCSHRCAQRIRNRNYRKSNPEKHRAARRKAARLKKKSTNQGDN